MLIVNAMYYKASWSTTFYELEQEGDFQTIDGDNVKIPMMHRVSFKNNAVSFESSSLPGMKITAVAIPYEVLRYLKNNDLSCFHM